MSALTIALVFWVFTQKQTLSQAFRALFSKKVWLSSSAKADYKIMLINQLLMKLLSPSLFSQLALATVLFLWFYEQLPSRPTFLSEWSTLSVGLVFTTSYFVLDDFARFYVHRLMHRIPSLWVFHKVHHNAEQLTPFTVLRTHPIEAIIFSLRSVLTQGISIGTFVFFLGDRADLVTVLGANVFVFFFNVVGSNLRHSHVPIRYWPFLEKLFISPAQHQIHHSIEKRHWDKNFGVALSVWDRLFGSFHFSETTPPIAFGVEGCKQHTLKSIYLGPFCELCVLLKRRTLSIYQRIRLSSRQIFRNSIYGSSNETR